MNKKIFAIEPAINLKEAPGFLLDWELTYNCNLDCSYCGDHDNRTKHPPLDKCLKSLEFMFKYVDLYMTYKRKWEKIVILNLYGGESLLHPDIVTILEKAKQLYEEKYKDNWFLSLTCTTNGIIGKNRMSDVIPFFDSMTISYHTEASEKQQAQCVDNILMLHSQGKRIQVNVMMHKDPGKWDNCTNLIDLLKEKNIRYIPYVVGDSNHKLVDQDLNSRYYKHTHTYDEQQVSWFKNHWVEKAGDNNKQEVEEMLSRKELEQAPDGRWVVRSMGRMCCGGKELCTNNNQKDRTYYVTESNYKDWYCSVNWYFLFVRQYQESIYHHKMCKANFGGTRDKLGFLDDADQILNDLEVKLRTSQMPIITCPNTYCGCGFCAPKAESIEVFKDIMVKHNKVDVWKK